MANLPPRGPKDRNCPLYKQPQCDVCDTCAWWQPWKVDTPEGKTIDEWRCAIEWLPAMMMQMARETVGVQQATESFRNEAMERQDAAARRLIEITQRQGPPAIKTIEVQNGS